MFGYAQSAVLLAALAIGLAGCGGSGPPEPVRAVVSGEVTYLGKPVEDGVIRFVSDKGPSAQGPIRNGSYRIDHKGGVPVGNCRVEIQGYEEQDIKDIGSTVIQMPKVVGVPIIPERYNAQSTLKVEVRADQENQHDFNL